MDYQTHGKIEFTVRFYVERWFYKIKKQRIRWEVCLKSLFCVSDSDIIVS